MSEHGRGLDGQTVARGRCAAGTGGKRYKQGWADEGPADGQASGPNRAKIARYVILARFIF